MFHFQETASPSMNLIVSWFNSPRVFHQENVSIKCIPLKPQLYIVKFGFAEAYLFFFFYDPKQRLLVLVRTASGRFLRAPKINVLSNNI